MSKQPDFENLAPYQPRRFVPAGVPLKTLELIRDLYRRLSERGISCEGELEQWILDRSELEAALHQEAAILYICMTLQTDDPKRAKAYTDYLEQIVPVLKPLDHELDLKFLKILEQIPLNEQKFGVYIRGIRSDVRLFVEENVELEKKTALLSQKYQALCGSLTVEFEGKERTLPEMGKFLLEPDRDLRERAWRATARRRLKEKEKFDGLFDDMLGYREQISRNAGFSNFELYQFQAMHRFDYAPDDCQTYHEAVEACVVPVWAQILKVRREKLGLKKLRPWDTAVDPLGRPPLKPFTGIQELIHGCERIFARIDPELGQQYREMTNLGLLDLASQKGKAPGGYQSSLDESRKPFIFMNAVGTDNDVRTLLHEAGHAFHSFACADQPLLDYRHGPMEFNEVASMGMELLADERISEFYRSEEEVRRSRRTHLEEIIFTLVWVATIDAFQHWIYEHPTHTADERREAWLAIRRRFGADLVDWKGLEEEHAYLWHRQLHIFEYPFYYIEYGIAQIGALQLWLTAKKDRPSAMRQYRRALALGGSRPLPEIFQAAGLQFNFSKETLRPLMDLVQEELRMM